MALTQAPRRFDHSLLRAVGLVLLTIGCGLAVGWTTVHLGPPAGFALLLAAPAAALASRSIWFLYGALLGVIALAPFLVIPVSAGGARPTLFEVVALALIGSYIVILLIDKRERLVVSVATALWFLYCAYLVAAFALGARFGVDQDLTRLFFRFGLALGMFWITVQLVRSRYQVAAIITGIIAASAVAAGGALALYAGGPALTFRVLSRLVPYGYPDTRVVRFIEDNPDNAMRAIGTGVDPNAFGGLMMIGFVLAVGLAFNRTRPIPIGFVVTAIALTGLAVLLTYSRGAWVGAATGAGVIIWFRARALVPIAAIAGMAALVGGLGSAFISRLEAGLRFQDAATRQRLTEYENAIAIIREHPWFGIGFGNAPSPEFGVGVSSIFLLVAEQTGLIGLAGFLIIVAVIALRGWRAFRRTNDDLVLTLGAAFAASLVVGFVDHYYFNIRFVHMVALFWILAGLLVVIVEKGLADVAENEGSS